jgi:regulator of sigma E protease
MPTTLAAFILVISVLVFFHELGHFLVARWFGVRVVTFSIGFGPKLLRLRRHDTEYCVSAIPLGGYVKMATGQPGAARVDEYHGKARWQRALIMAAGPAMNFLLAIAALTVIALHGIDMPSTAGHAARLQPSLWPALSLSTQAAGVLIIQVLGTVRGLVSGAVSLRDLAGPIGIARIAGQSARSGWIDLLALTTMLSVNLGVMNLLPLPTLDGGNIALTAIDGIRRRDMSLAMRRRILNGGFVVLLALTAGTIYNDITRLAGEPASASAPSVSGTRASGR